ncbi:hypothetical protein AgCh_017237 [Apium graveolens]
MSRIKARERPTQTSKEKKKSEFSPGSQRARTVIVRGRAQSVECQRARAGQACGRASACLATNKWKGSKSRPIALKVEGKPMEKARRKSYSKGKTMIVKSYIESSNSDDDSNIDTESDTDSDHNNNEDMKQMVSLLVKSFKKMVYKNFNKGRRFSRKADYRKPRAEKNQALISKKKNWDDSSNSDVGVNYALMEKADAEAENAELKVPPTTLAFDTNDIYKLRLFLKSLHVSYRDQTLENNKIKSENSLLKKRNDHLEIELLSMIAIQKERDNVVYVKKKMLKKHAYLEKELAKEREVIKL